MTVVIKCLFICISKVALTILASGCSIKVIWYFKFSGILLKLPTLEPILIASFFAQDGLRDKKILMEEAHSAIKKAWTDAPDPVFEEATAWQLDPYSYGSYASFSVETKGKDIVNIMSPEWGGKFVFAGDAIVPIGLMGCFHSAYISALCAARLIDEYLTSYVKRVAK